MSLGKLFPTESMAVLMSTIPKPQKFTQSLKLDSELGRLTLEHGTMLGPPTEAERAEERSRKESARRVRTLSYPQSCPRGHAGVSVMVFISSSL